VLVCDLPGILCDVVQHLLEGQSDLALVGGPVRASDLLVAALSTQPDVVIIDLADPDLPPVGEALLRQAPAVGLLGVIPNDGRAFLYQLRPERVALGELSAEGLLDAVRAAAATAWH
jgi:DNA-binding NarL/FixJ family response regulator